MSVTATASLPGSNAGRAVLATAAANPDLLAIVTRESMIDFSQFAGILRRLAQQFQARGIGPGSILSIDADDPVTVFGTLMASALLGACWVAARAARPLKADLHPTHHITTDPAAPDPTAPITIVIEPGWFTGPAPSAADDAAFPGPADLEAPWIYAPTSGTTGTAKLVCLSQRIMLDRASAVLDDFRPRETVMACLFICSAFPHLVRATACLVNGCTMVNALDPAMWRAAGVNHVYGSVTQVADLLGHRVLPQKMPLIHVSGSKLTDALARHLLQSFDQVIDLYASTETNRSFKNIKSLSPDGRIVTTGQATDAEVQIVNDAGQPVGQNEVGRVRVRNGYLAPGYLNNPAAQAASFRDGWFYPGDLALWGPQGGLQVIGRAGDVINLGGVKVNALEIDEVMQSVPGVADAMCFENPRESGPSELLAFVVFAPGADGTTIAEAMRAAFAARLGPARRPARFVEVNKVPRAHDGGAKRFLCQKLYRDLRAAQGAQAGH
ncbi:MAG: AMP-binding protein [Limimaricola sp.]|uniref:class I adenylate-forming enzyme family protein n=1 Tax=Limimaricola sp. TaxID=2211665 RepID=UPI001D253FD6|nr:class I adenylate-forming enzyme family protein [Limimaricola sp.]MBI1416610.1 AMP-binding protein [Limimaricola sp.]